MTVTTSHNAGVLTCIVPIQETEVQGQILPVPPLNMQNTQIWVLEYGQVMTIKKAEKLARRDGAKMYFNYLYHGKSILPGTQDFVDLEESFTYAQSLFNHIEYVEVPKVEIVRDWLFTFKFSVGFAVCLQVAIWLGILFNKLAGG